MTPLFKSQTQKHLSEGSLGKTMEIYNLEEILANVYVIASIMKLILPSICYRRRQWHPTPILLPGKSHGWRSLVASVHGVAKSQTQLRDFTFTFHFHALEKEMATHSSVLAWRIPGVGEPGGLLSMGSHRVGHNWRDLAVAVAVSGIPSGIMGDLLRSLVTTWIWASDFNSLNLQFYVRDFSLIILKFLAIFSHLHNLLRKIYKNDLIFFFPWYKLNFKI